MLQVAKESSACKLLMTIPGAGLLSATAIVPATCVAVSHFKSARHLGLTPKENSSRGTEAEARLQDGAIAICACCSPTAQPVAFQGFDFNNFGNHNRYSRGSIRMRG